MVNNKALHAEQICRLVGAGNPADEVLHWVTELEDAGVFSTDEEGIIYCRRMVDDQALEGNEVRPVKIKSSPRARTRVEDDIKKGKRYTRKGDVTKALRDGVLSYDEYPGFVRFWNNYPARNGVRSNKQEAAVSWVWLELEQHSSDIIDSVQALKKTHDWKKEQGKFVPMATTFLNNKRWEDEVEEYQPTAWKAEVKESA